MPRDSCDVLCLDLEKAEAVRRSRLAPALADQAASQAKALADPTRLTLAFALAQTDEACVCDLSWIMERAENLVSHHLKVLRQAGLVESRPEGKMVLYHLSERGSVLVELAVDGLPTGALKP
jgi:ArsR family transcriptional regulator, lead/cadmium/zinc/bismuth-responsive transcriptional repressor